MSTVTLRGLVARQVRQIRTRRKWRQDDLAARAQGYGLGWTQATVAGIESEHRELTGFELLLLPSILGCRSLFEALRLRGDVLVEGEAAVRDAAWEPLTQGRPVPASEMARHYEVDTTEGPATLVLGPVTTMPAIREPERRAARRLGITPNRVFELSVRLWGRTLTEERDRRLRVPAAKRSAYITRGKAGQITRQLVAELKARLELEDK